VLLPTGRPYSPSPKAPAFKSLDTNLSLQVNQVEN
jgi:hypothetical protein